MKLRNKKTGEIVEYDNIFFYKLTCKGNEKFKPNAQTISELNEDWEDYKEEPKDYWCLTSDGKVYCSTNYRDIKLFKQIGNYFETREEAEKAVEKLKAWKRLKDKGFKTSWFTVDNPDREDDGKIYIKVLIDTEPSDFSWVKDLDLLFGDGKE